MTCNELLAEAHAVARTIDEWPDSDGLGEALVFLTHAIEDREARRARLVIERTRSVAEALAVKEER